MLFVAQCAMFVVCCFVIDVRRPLFADLCALFADGCLWFVVCRLLYVVC